MRVQLDVSPDYFVQEANQSAGDSIDVHGLRLQYLAPRESQQFARERGGSFGLLADSRKSLGNLMIRAILLQDEFRPSQNRTYHVVEILGDTSRKLPDGFEFLRLPQLRSMARTSKK